MTDKEWWLLVMLFGWTVFCCGATRSIKAVGLVTAISGLLFAALGVAHATECYPTMEAAKAAHPGASHYAWNGTGKHRRYFAGDRGERCTPTERQVMRNGAPRKERALESRPVS